MSDEIQRTLGRIEEKVDALVLSAGSHENRISNLEKWKAWTLGAATVASIVAGALWSIVTRG